MNNNTVWIYHNGGAILVRPWVLLMSFMLQIWMKLMVLMLMMNMLTIMTMMMILMMILDDDTDDDIYIIV